MLQKVLLLDSGYYPIKLIDWKKAMILFFTGRAELVEAHDHVRIHATTTSFALPKVLRLFQKHFKQTKRVKFNRNNVFLRDDFTCQYCGGTFHPKLLSFDHVIPRSKGGKTSWENIVTCCRDCNNKKADKYLKDTGMKLLKKPKEPRWTPFLGLQLRPSEEEIFKDWLVPA